MALIIATQIRVGNLIEFEGNVYRVFQMDHVTPGKGRGHVQVRMKDIENGTNKDNRFRSDDKVTKIQLDQREVEFLYSDPESGTFMDMETYEQLSLPKDFLGEALNFLTANSKVTVNFHGSKAVGIELPVAVDLVVSITDAALKGSTVTNQFKPATLETDLVVQVPAFIKEGDTIRVDTVSGKYLERVTSA
jgi:elongation factor P